MSIQLSDAAGAGINVPSHSDVIIFTAIDALEKKILHEELTAAGVKELPPTSSDRRYNLHQWRVFGKSGNKNINISTKCLNTAGNAVAGIELMSILQVVQPDLICFCGIAGSLSPLRAPLGSVVVGERVFLERFR